MRFRLSAALAMLAYVAVVLAFGGVHAVLAQMVADERRDLIIRLALGAGAIRSLLFGVQPLDVEVIAAGIAILLALAVFASASPAGRIGPMDPAAALRGD